MDEPQNIYDDPLFFEGYSLLRANPLNYNELLEQPAFHRLLPDLVGKSVLDLGCGSGDSCEAYAKSGADPVIGIDLSENMLRLARTRNNTGNGTIEYHCMDMMNIGALGRRFDVITSSLAVHYVKDFEKLVELVWECLVPEGIFVFSQEHPLTTAPSSGVEYQKDESGRSINYLLNDYGRPGFRSVRWFVDNVEKYHRMFSQIINALIQAGFMIEAIDEPLPDDTLLEKVPRMYREYIKPSFLLIRAKKRQSIR